MLQYLLIIIILIVSQLAYATTNVPPVIVKNSRFNPEGKIRITQEEIEKIGATSLTQALQTLGGVQLQDVSGNSSQVLLSMRGFGSNANSNTLLLVNGIPLTNPDLAPPDLNAIPIQEIEYIEIFAGSESVLYGDQAVGGIIQIVTKHTSKKSAAFSCGSGSYNQYNCYAAGNYPVRGLQFAIGGLQSHTDNYRDQNDYDQSLLSGKIEYPYDSGTVYLQYKIAKELMQYPGALTAKQVDENRRQANNDTDFFKDTNGFYHLHLSQSLNSEWLLESDLAVREMHGNGVLYSPFLQSRNIEWLKPQVKGTLEKFSLQAGLDVEHDQYQLETDFGDTQDALYKYGVFGLVNVPIDSRLTLNFGARAAEQNSELVSTIDSHAVNRAFASTLGVSMTFSEQMFGFLRRAGSFRFPKADENASTSPNIKNLKTQQGVAYETGIEFHFAPTVTKISLFQLNLKDEITFDPNQTPEDPFGTNRNLDPTVRRGFSISEKWEISQLLSLGAQYHFVNARFQSGSTEGKRIPLVAENNFQMGLDYAFKEYWNLYSEAIYTGNQFAANDDANVTSPIGGYTIFNTHLRFEYQHFTASLRLNNIFNKYYDFYSIYMPTIDTEYFYPAPGRNVLFTLKYLLE